MASIVKNYADARAKALSMILTDHADDTVYIFECNGTYRVSSWGDPIDRNDTPENPQQWQFVGRVLPDGTWSPRSGPDVPHPQARSENAGSITPSLEESPLAGIEITRKTVNALNREADRRGVSREAFRAMANVLASYDKSILDMAEHLVRHHGLLGVKKMAERGW